MRALHLTITLVGAASAGCNAIFGIVGGEVTGGGGGGAGGTTGSTTWDTGATTGTETTTATGGGGTGGAGGGCLPERPDTCEPTTLDDPESCCIAGRSCQGGACESGECGPVPIAASQNPDGEEVLDVVVVGDKVFWSSGYGTKLYMTSIDGGPQFTHATSNDSPNKYLTRLAADAEHIYYTNWGSGRIVRVPVEGGALEIVAEVPDSGTPPEAGFGQIALGGGHVFWAMANTGGAYHAALASLPAEAELLDAAGWHGMATDETFVYWSTTDGAILKRPLSDLSAAPETVVSGQGSILDIEVIEDRVYWATYGSVSSAVKDGLNKLLVTVYNGGVTPLGIAGDGRDVFFTLAGCDSCNPPARGYLYRAPVLGGPLVELVASTGFGDVRGVTMDCDTVYAANSADRSVLKLTR